MASYSFNDVERAFEEALDRAGIPRDKGQPLYLDGRKHRYRVKGDKAGEKSGEYCVYMDDHPAGWFKSYKASHGVEYVQWCFSRDCEFGAMSYEEREAWLAERARVKEERDAAQRKERARAADVSRRRWRAATELLCPHGYVLAKGLHSWPAARLLDNDIVLPFRNADFEITTVQTVSSSGDKRFQSGGQKLGSFCVISDRVREDGLCELPKEGRLFVSEGWATGVSVFEAMKCPVVAAADKGNLLPVVKELRRVCPGCELVVASDNDKAKGKGNPGESEALKIYEMFGIPYVCPVFDASELSRHLSDWNDFAAARGLEAVRSAIEAQLEEFKKDLNYGLARRFPQWVDVFPAKSESELPKPKSTIGNFRALLKFLGVSLSYDEVVKDARAEIPNESFSPDTRASAERAWLLSKCNEYGLPKGDLDDFYALVANENVVNPVREWILSRPWDGRRRVETVIDCVKCHSVKATYKDFVMRKWFLSCVAAQFYSNGSDRRFACEGTLVFQGAQGLGKTSFFRMLAGRAEWFGNGLSVDPTDKDSVRRAVSCWIVELGELEGNIKKVDQSRLKAFLTNDCDRFRVPYGKRDDVYERRTVFCGTVNQFDFLSDDTGNRRYWCLPVVSVDVERLRSVDIQQFWAEVYVDYLKVADDAQKNFAWWLTPEELTELQSINWKFEAPDKIEDLITSKLDWDAWQVSWVERTATEILIECGMLNPMRGDAMKASRILRKLTGREAKHNGHARVFLAPPVKSSSVYR